MSRFANLLLLLLGYTLVYAGIANGGRFAQAPWRGLFEDAYGGTTGQAPPAATPTIPEQQPGTGGPQITSPGGREPQSPIIRDRRLRRLG